MTDRLMLELDYPQVWSRVPAGRCFAKRLVKRAYQSYLRLMYQCFRSPSHFRPVKLYISI